MIELLTLIILVSLFSNGLFYITTTEGMPLYWLDQWVEKKLKDRERYYIENYRKPDDGLPASKIKDYAHRWIFIYSPILGCITCMSSVWGALFYWLFIGFSYQSYYELPIVILSSAYLNTLMFNYVRKY